jgi:tetratricopeptide (TPR) repeat protein
MVQLESSFCLNDCSETFPTTTEVTMRIRWQVSITFLIFSLTVLSGCSKEQSPRPNQGMLDTPSFHVMRGKDLLDEQRVDAASKQFDLGLELKANYAPALAGKALVKTLQSQQIGLEPRKTSKLLEDAENLLDKALSKADGPNETLSVHLLAMRTITARAEGDDWINVVENHFDEALEIFDNNPDLQASKSEPWYYWGHSNEKALNFEIAQKAFTQVLELNRGFTREANLAIEQLNKVVRAQPGTRHGKELVMIEQITRADMAALLMQELKLADLYSRNSTQQTQELNFESPTKQFVSYDENKLERPLASDISEHPLREDIETVLKLQVRGLEANPQYLFFPNKEITRAEYALMLEDVLIQVTQNSALSTRFVGDTSPFVDVRPDAYYYNAARTLVSRNIMQLQDRIRGEFGPDRAVAGADALLSLRLLKDELQRFVRPPSS